MTAANAQSFKRGQSSPQFDKGNQLQYDDNESSTQLLVRRCSSSTSFTDINGESFSSYSTISQRLHEDLELLREEKKKISKDRDEAIRTVKDLHNQHRNMYENFKLLREKYDDLKAEILHILWEYIPSQQAATLAGFDDLNKVNHAVFETSDRISDYNIGPLLGEGQFADVKVCTHIMTSKEYAMKVLSKDKIMSLAALQRARTEIHLLKQLRHPNIVDFVDFIHSPKCLYIITELGGQDLFEFFDANPNGVADDIACQIILGIVQPLVYLHKSCICHRDLKPENILLKTPNDGAPILHQHVKICDFGHSAVETSYHEKSFKDLCGSPGFFAPEMILGDNHYNGFAADVWSVGCIMLELTKGHDEFCKLWMTSYDYNILHDEVQFRSSLQKAITEINQGQTNVTTGSNADDKYDSSDFLNKLLVLEPEGRIMSSKMLSHPWFHEVAKESAIAIGNDSISINAKDDGDEDSSLLSLNCIDATKLIGDSQSKPNTPRGKRNIFRDSLSARARKHFAGADTTNFKMCGKEGLSDHICSEPSLPFTCNQIKIHLPPIEPRTPSFRTIKKKFLESEKVVLSMTGQGIKSYRSNFIHNNTKRR